MATLHQKLSARVGEDRAYLLDATFVVAGLTNSLIGYAKAFLPKLMMPA